jgi:peptidyl-prolyl cis-trans isomerase SurA
MMRPLRWMLFLAVAATRVAGQGPAPHAVMDRIAAVVGSEPILLSDVDIEMRVFAERSQRALPADTASAEYKSVYFEIVNQLIDFEVVVQFAKLAKITIPEEDIARSVADMINRLRSEYPADSTLRRVLRENGFASVEAFRTAKLEATRRGFLRDEFLKKAKKDGKLTAASVSEAELAREIQKLSPEDRRRPTVIEFKDIILRTRASEEKVARARAKAESLLVRLRAGANFDSLARRESMDASTRDAGGDLGFRKRGSGLVADFENVIFELAPGEVSPVFETSYGFHIVKVDQVRPPNEVRSRHILIRPATDSTDVAASRVLADSIAAMWRAGTSYDTLVARYHDPEEPKFVGPNYPRDSLPPAYQVALKGLKVGDVSAPIELENPAVGFPSFAIARVTMLNERGEFTDEEVREELRNRIAGANGYRRFVDKLRSQVYISIVH